MRRVFIPLVGVAVVSVTLLAQAQADSSLLDRVLPAQNRHIFALSWARSVQGIAYILSRSGGVPVVIELAPGAPIEISERIDLRGMTVRDVLEQLAAIDPRYLWRENDGVIVIRPVSAWADPRNQFNEPVELSMSDVTAATVFDRVKSLLWPWLPLNEQIASDQRDTRALSIDVRSGSLLDVLIASAHAHGDMVWVFTPTPNRLALPKAVVCLDYETFTETVEFRSGRGPVQIPLGIDRIDCTHAAFLRSDRRNSFSKKRPLPRGDAIPSVSVLDTWVTVHSGDMGSTFGPKGFSTTDTEFLTLPDSRLQIHHAVLLGESGREARQDVTVMRRQSRS